MEVGAGTERGGVKESCWPAKGVCNHATSPMPLPLIADMGLDRGVATVVRGVVVGVGVGSPEEFVSMLSCREGLQRRGGGQM